jgi:hypothetical protein
MTKDQTKRTALTPEFRAAFPKLFRPEAMRKDGKEFYSVEAVFAPDADLTELKKLASRVKHEHWGDNAPRKLVSPFRNGNEYNREREEEGKNPRPELEDCTIIRLKTTMKPEIVELNPNIPITDETEIYGGVRMRASIYCHPYEATKKDPTMKSGIAFLLNNVQKLGDAEQWGTTRQKARDDFDDDVSQKSEASGDFGDGETEPEDEWS